MNKENDEPSEKMSTLDPELRSAIETIIDNIISHPKEYEDFFAKTLEYLNINSDLEKILAFIVGCIWGEINLAYRSRYSTGISISQQVEILNILKRRANEIKEAFISTRIEK